MNHKPLAVSLFALLLPACVTTMPAWTVNLEQDMGAQGVLRQCKYSDGRIHAF